MRKHISQLLSEYGAVAAAVYFTIFFAVLLGFWAAIHFGWGSAPAGAAGQAGTLAAAYVATKLTQPLRIGATVVLTPLVARLYERVRGIRGTSADGDR